MSLSDYIRSRVDEVKNIISKLDEDLKPYSQLIKTFKEEKYIKEHEKHKSIKDIIRETSSKQSRFAGLFETDPDKLEEINKRNRLAKQEEEEKERKRFDNIDVELDDFDSNIKYNLDLMNAYEQSLKIRFAKAVYKNVVYKLKSISDVREKAGSLYELENIITCINDINKSENKKVEVKLEKQLFDLKNEEANSSINKKIELLEKEKDLKQKLINVQFNPQNSTIKKLPDYYEGMIKHFNDSLKGSYRQINNLFKNKDFQNGLAQYLVYVSERVKQGNLIIDTIISFKEAKNYKSVERFEKQLEDIIDIKIPAFTL